LLKKENERILLKLEEKKNYLAELGEMLPNKEEYIGDLVKRRACEKTIGLAIESLIDACSMVVSFCKLGIPSDEDNIFDILVKKNFIKESLGKQLKEIKGFRNILTHRYGDINDTLAYEFMSTDLMPFIRFEEVVKRYLSNKS